MKLILLGAPGAGKGTQADIIKKTLGIPTISTGNILRAAVKNGTPTGLRAKECMDAGKLVSDDIIIDIIGERLAEPDCANGYILDGVPVGMASFFFRISAWVPLPAPGAPKRMSFMSHLKEGVCDVCGGKLVQRKDDDPETVKSRLAEYHKTTEPLKDFYAARGILKVVDDQPTVEATTAAVLKVLGC